jgi:hypothetical protein
MVSTGRDYYSYFEFLSMRTALVFLTYFSLRSMIVLSYQETRPLIVYLPLKIIYDMINGILTGYLYIRYISGIGVRMVWGNREEVVT